MSAEWGAVCVVLGTVAFVVGLWVMYPPLALITTGVIVALLGVGYMRGEVKR